MRLDTQRTGCAAIHRFAGYDVLLAKANQPSDGERMCAAASRSRRLIVVIGGKRAPVPKGMGGWKSANWSKASNASEWLAAWPGVEQGFCLQRTSSRQGQVHTQTVYGMTKLSTFAGVSETAPGTGAEATSPSKIGWHSRWDVTVREDHSQVRKGDAPQVWAALNHLILAVRDAPSGPACPRADAGLRCPATAGGSALM